MLRLIFVTAVLFLSVLPGCTHSLTMHSRDGEKLSGKYRFARENTGLVRVSATNGETLAGKFASVRRATFVESYQKTFGRGTIAVDGPDLATYGNPFGGVFGNSYGVGDTAYGERFVGPSGSSKTVVRGALFYWIASLRGDRGTTMECYFIGSSYTGHGFGRCKNNTGKEYSVDF